MVKPIEPDVLVLVVFIALVILAGTWSTIFSLTTARRLYKKLKEAGDEPRVNLDVFSMIHISIILCFSYGFLERKYPNGYTLFHNWRIIKANATKYNTVSAWIFNFFNMLVLINLTALIILK